MFICHFAWKSAMMCVQMFSFEMLSYRFPILLLKSLHFSNNNNNTYSDASDEYSVLTQNFMSQQALYLWRHWQNTQNTFTRNILSHYIRQIRSLWLFEMPLNCQSKWFMNKIQILYGNASCESKDQNLERKMKIRLILIWRYDVNKCEHKRISSLRLAIVHLIWILWILNWKRTTDKYSIIQYACENLKCVRRFHWLPVSGWAKGIDVKALIWIQLDK